MANNILCNIGTRKVLEELLRGNNTPGAIAKKLKITHSAVIQQLNRLKNAGLCSSKKEGRKTIYFPKKMRIIRSLVKIEEELDEIGMLVE